MEIEFVAYVMAFGEAEVAVMLFLKRTFFCYGI